MRGVARPPPPDAKRSVVGPAGLAVLVALFATGCGDGEPEVARGRGVARPEHPRPDFRRDTYINLNSKWQFAFDPTDVGVTETWFARNDVWTDRVQLPFAWEAPLSGLVPPHEGAYSVSETLKATTYRGVGWYRLRYPEALPVTPGAGWYVVFGAVDFDATVWVNGREAAHHRGGYDPFAVALEADADAPFSLVVRAEDRTELDDRAQPVGKQGGAWYTRTSGIWQSVYLEQRPAVHLSSIELRPNLAAGHVVVVPELSQASSARIALTARLDGEPVGTLDVDASSGDELELDIAPVLPWDASSPTLYDLDVSVRADASAEDRVHSYFGMVQVGTDWLPGHAPADTSEASEQYQSFVVNGRPTYLSCVLDQSYHPDGVYTAPDLEAIRSDLQFAKDMGFNCIRLHIKPDEPVKYRLLDELGFYVVYDIPSLDLLAKNEPGFVGRTYFEETMRAVMARDRNHPSILSWVVFNENWGLMTSGSLLEPTTLASSPDLQQWVIEMVAAAREIDPSRPVEDNSAGGVVKAYEHLDTDSNSFHYYGADPAKLRAFLDAEAAGVAPGSSASFVGGALQDGDPWWTSEIASFSTLGGSDGPKIFCDLFGIENELRRQPKLVGRVLTQLTDVEYELNGLTSYDRSAKPDLCTRDGVGLGDLFGEEFVAFDWLPAQSVPRGSVVNVPLLPSQWSSAVPASRSIRLSWVGGAASEQVVTLAPYAPVAVDVPLATPDAAGPATLVAELLDEDGRRTAANRISVSVE